MSEQEHCPRCTVGLLYVVRDEADSEALCCFHCHYAESRVKPGYEVTEPGEPITKRPAKGKKVEEAE